MFQSLFLQIPKHFLAEQQHLVSVQIRVRYLALQEVLTLPIPAWDASSTVQQHAAVGALLFLAYGVILIWD